MIVLLKKNDLNKLNFSNFGLTAKYKNIEIIELNIKHFGQSKFY